MRRGFQLAVALAMLALPVLVFSYGSTAPPERHTGGFGEPTCAQCHTGVGVNQGGGKISLVNPPATYTSSQRVSFSLKVEDPTAMRWGFELAARSLDGRQAGSFAPGPGQTTASGGGILYLSHSGGATSTQAGTAASATFNFSWIAPDVSAGTVAFDIAANAANNNGQNTGDHIYQTRFTINAGTTGNLPGIFFGGVVNGASFIAAPQNTVAPGTVVSIFGRNLAPTTAAATKLPLDTVMGNTVVTFNGVPAPLYFVSPTQINAQVPDLFGVFDFVQVQVTVNNAVSSIENVPFQGFSPGIFTRDQNGKAIAGVLHQDNSPVTATSPARRGEVVQIFCSGLGSTSPPLIPGQAAPRIPLASTDSPVRVSIGGVTNLVPQFAGLTPDFAGLYQVNVQIPSGAMSGLQTLKVSVGGFTSRDGVTIPIQ